MFITSYKKQLWDQELQSYQFNSTTMQSRTWASHLFPWQSLAFSLLPVTDSVPGITASYNSTKGRGRFSFYQRGKIFQKHTTLKKQQNKHTTLTHLSLVSLNCVRPCASTPCNQSLAKMVMMVKTNSDLEGGAHCSWVHCGKTPDQN